MSKSKGARSFSEQFKAECAKRNTSLADVAGKVGVSRSYISQVMRFGAKADTIETLAKAIGCKPDTFDAYRNSLHYKAVLAEDPTALQFANIIATFYRQPTRKAIAMMAALNDVAANFQEDW